MTAAAEGRTTVTEPSRAGLARHELPGLAFLALAVTLAAFHLTAYVSTGAHLWHFDAKAHLVVARRVLDSLTPGWIQLGAVWLPLPHILNSVPAQHDGLYRSGLFASGLSFTAFVLGLVALQRAVVRATGDSWAGAVAIAVPALNPGWLYLLATPLIEPLWFGAAAVFLFYLLRYAAERRTLDLLLATLSAAAVALVRYEAWPLVAGATLLVVGIPWRARSFLWGLGLLGPIVFFALHSWLSTGVPLYVIGRENLTDAGGDPLGAAARLGAGSAEAFGAPLVIVATLAACWLALRRWKSPLFRAGAAALAPAIVTWVAYLAGHPPKARYALLLAPAFALLLAAATSGRRLVQFATLAVAALQSPCVPRPLPVLVEATRDAPKVALRKPALAVLREEYAGGRILASMGSLAPVLFELGLPLSEVVHEGNGNLWTYAVVDPAADVAWVMIARGDILDQQRRFRRRFPERFTPFLEFPDVVVYRSDAAASRPPRDVALGAPPRGTRAQALPVALVMGPTP